MLHRAILIAIALMPTTTILGQDVVPIGKGSYASFPPPDAAKEADKVEKNTELFVVNKGDRALPTNKWWTQLIVSKFARSLWVYPMKVETSEQGVNVFFPTRWQPEGNDPASEFPITFGGVDFQAQSASAKDWSDWLVSFRFGAPAEDAQAIDVTLGEGMPCAWFEYRNGLAPQLQLPGGVAPKFFDKTGKPLANISNLKADAVGIEVEGRRFGVFAPDGTTFKLAADRKLDITFANAQQTYLVICPLLTAKDIATVYKHAYAIPRSTKCSWDYDPAKAIVTTTWAIETEALKGPNKEIIQGWLPHHWRNTENTLKLNEAFTYISPRGPLKCGIGNSFTIEYPFQGIVPNLPAPKTLDGPNPYDPERMKWYLEKLAADPKYREDTYWGGKDILSLGQNTIMAQQIGETDLQKQFTQQLNTAMTDWFTYEPGETAHYFTWYPNWKALVGYKTSYGSEAFNDHHFHYGYFTQASGMLAAQDKEWADDFKEMATFVGKEYANWDRADERLPFMRCFDIWAGHGWAGGTSSPGGNNQESSSEDIQSFAGLVYLGQALGDKDMLAAGAMGYAMESRALMEYWFDPHGDVFPKEWPHDVTGMVWGGGKVYGTYFTGDAAWIYAIQWLPASPALNYLARDPAFAKKMYDFMERDAKKQNKPTAIKDLGAGLGNVMLGYRTLWDPAWVTKQMDDMWADGEKSIVRDAKEMAIHYYMSHSMRNLGLVDWDSHTSSPTSMVFFNDKTKTRTAVVWNPTATEQTFDVYVKGKAVGKVIAKPQGLTAEVVK